MDAEIDIAVLDSILCTLRGLKLRHRHLTERLGGDQPSRAMTRRIACHLALGLMTPNEGSNLADALYEGRLVQKRW